MLFRSITSFARPTARKQSNDHESHVKFPPLVTVLSQSWVCVVIVVPAFAVSDDRDKPIVSAVVSCLVVLVSPHVGCGINKPSCVHHGHHSYANHPNKPGYCQGWAADEIANASYQGSECDVNWQEEVLEEHGVLVLQKIRYPFFGVAFRIAIVGGEGQPECVCPPRSIVRRVRVTRLIAVRMMLAMVGCPTDRSTLACQCSDG